MTKTLNPADLVDLADDEAMTLAYDVLADLRRRFHPNQVNHLASHADGLMQRFLELDTEYRKPAAGFERIGFPARPQPAGEPDLLQDGPNLLQGR